MGTGVCETTWCFRLCQLSQRHDIDEDSGQMSLQKTLRALPCTLADVMKHIFQLRPSPELVAS